MATLEAKRRRSANRAEKLKGEGQAKKAFWLQADTLAALEIAAAKFGGSETQAVNEAIRRLGLTMTMAESTVQHGSETVQTTVVKPPKL